MIIACRLLGSKPLSEQILDYFKTTHGNEVQWYLLPNATISRHKKMILLENVVLTRPNFKQSSIRYEEL